MKTYTQSQSKSTAEIAVKVISTILTVVMTSGLVAFAYKAVCVLQANGLLPR